MNTGLTFGEKLSDLRILRGLSQEEVAHAVGIDRSTLGKYESNQAIPGGDKLVKLARLYRVSCEYIMDDECMNANTHDALDGYFAETDGKPFRYRDFLDSVMKLSPKKRRELLVILEAWLEHAEETPLVIVRNENGIRIFHN